MINSYRVRFCVACTETLRSGSKLSPMFCSVSVRPERLIVACLRAVMYWGGASAHHAINPGLSGWRLSSPSMYFVLDRYSAAWRLAVRRHSARHGTQPVGRRCNGRLRALSGRCSVPGPAGRVDSRLVRAGPNVESAGPAWSARAGTVCFRP